MELNIIAGVAGSGKTLKLMNTVFEIEPNKEEPKELVVITTNMTGAIGVLIRLIADEMERPMWENLSFDEKLIYVKKYFSMKKRYNIVFYDTITEFLFKTEYKPIDIDHLYIDRPGEDPTKFEDIARVYKATECVIFMVFDLNRAAHQLMFEQYSRNDPNGLRELNHTHFCSIQEVTLYKEADRVVMTRISHNPSPEMDGDGKSIFYQYINKERYTKCQGNLYKYEIKPSCKLVGVDNTD